jgi:long-chain fatty acid transport protein
MRSQRNLLALMIALFSGHSVAGGLYLYEMGTEDLGLAGAGMAARAQDASTVFSNPAGMTLLEGDQFTGGLQGLYGDASYQLDENSGLSGTSPGNTVGFSPQGSLFYSHSISSDLKVGLAMFGNFGLGLDYGSWAGETLITDTSLMALTMQPTVAYRLDEHWSIGGGVGINYGSFSLGRETNDGSESLDDHDWALNSRMGLLYELDKATRLGLAYSSRTKYNFDINARVTKTISIPGPLPDKVLQFDVPITAGTSSPQQLMFSGYHQLNSLWALLANIGWQDWSTFSDGSIYAAGREVPDKTRLQDTWHMALGTQYQYSQKWRFNGGVAFDSSFYKSQSNTSLTLPSGPAWRIGIGAQYRLTNNSTVGSAFEYLTMGDATVPSELVGGSYDDMHLYFMSLNYSYHF